MEVMVAVTDAGAPARAVAAAVSPAELWRPGSDLARLVAGCGRVDLLVACDEDPPTGPSVSDLDDPDDDPEPGATHLDEVPAALARLGLPGLRLHRLGLRAPLSAGCEADLVAALSELVGFDPEPGVCCVAPEPAPDDPNRTAVARAAERVARVYGLPVLRYRSGHLGVDLAAVADSA